MGFHRILREILYNATKMAKLCENTVTRMHSSRMRTTRSMTVCRSIPEGGLSAQHPWMQTPWSCDLWCMLGNQPPPLWTEWQTVVKTIPLQTSFAGGKNGQWGLIAGGGSPKMIHQSKKRRRSHIFTQFISFWRSLVTSQVRVYSVVTFNSSPH